MKTLLVILLFSIFINVSAFSDIENNWYKESINTLKDKGIVDGYSDNIFGPYNSISRAETLKIIMKAADIELNEVTESCFDDVDINSWQAKYICTGVEKGIAKGYGNGTFDPDGQVTIIEVLAFLVRAYEIDLSSYDNSGEWYELYQDFADKNKIVATHSYTKNNHANRGVASNIIYRLYQHNQGEKQNYNSIGCKQSSNLQSGEYSININGQERKFLLYVPKDTNSNNPKSLIVAFHGRTNSNEMVRSYMNIGGGRNRSTNNQNDFIVAYPAGTGDGPYSWHQQENIEFFDGIVSYINNEMCINRDKVFSVGHSLGSWMSNKVSCLRGDVVRAMVGVASDGYNSDCYGAVSSLITHLKDDNLASYQGGLNAYSYKSNNNLCTSETEKISLGGINNCEQKISCSGGNTVTFCNSYDTYQSDPHGWPRTGGSDILNFLNGFE